MTSSDRYVVDTNVMVSALLFISSKPGRAFLAALDRGVVLISLQLLAELQAALGRPKFDRYLTQDEREDFLAALIREAALIDVTVQIAACRDPKDDQLLALAVSGHATCIVTGDADLLQLHPFQGIPILSPDAFLNLLAIADEPDAIDREAGVNGTS